MTPLPAATSESLEGVTVVDPYTVKFELTRPDATFLHVMAINFAHVVPKEEVEKYGADFGKHPVGTGAYKLTEWTLGQRLVFERNADYWHKGLPHLDKITFEIGQEPIVALLRLQKGEVDVPGDGIPPAKFQEVMADPEQKARVVEGGQLHTGYVTMNTQHGAVRQCEGPPGRQHGDQQGPHRPADQQPRGAGQPAAAAVDARLRQGLQGLCLRRREGQGAARRSRPSRTASRPSCSP